MSAPVSTRPSGTAVLAGIGRGVLLVVGVAMLVAAVQGAGTPAAVLGALVLGLGLAGTALALTRRGLGRAERAEVVTTDGGSRATRVSAPVTTVLLPVLAVLWSAGSLGVWAGVLVTDDQPTSGALVGLVAVVALVAGVVPPVRGLVGDRVDLHPQGLTARRHGERVEIAWDDVAGCVPPQQRGEPMAVVLQPGAAPSTTRGWPLWPGHPRSPDGVVAVAVADLEVDPLLLSRVVALCADRPEHRAALGTPASTDWRSFPPT